MTARPLDWQPLADSDPIGGDVAAVRGEAQYYSGLAEEISAQVARLRKIAAEGEQIGKMADKLRSVAGDTAGKLDQTHGRVAAVGSALTAWVPQLDDVQARTLDALHAAQEAAADMNANQPPAPGSPPPKTDADKQAAKARAGRYGDASSRLSIARSQFDSAVSDRDTWADAVAKQIKDALHDGLNDSWWDSFCDWVSQHVEIIKMIVDILSWVATGLAILALCFTGVGLLAVLAIAFTTMTLLGHTMLAATGNGSWFDVALDVFALATLGTGKILAGLGKAGELGMGMRGAELEGNAARATVAAERATVKAGLEDATSSFARRWLTPSGWRAARALRGFDQVTEGLQSEADTAARLRTLGDLNPEASLAERLSAQDETAASTLKYLSEHANTWTSDATVNAYRGLADFGANGAKWAFRTVSTVDMANHLASPSDIPGVNNALVGVPGVADFKDTAGEWIAHNMHLPTGVE